MENQSLASLHNLLRLSVNPTSMTIVRHSRSWLHLSQSLSQENYKLNRRHNWWWKCHLGRPDDHPIANVKRSTSLLTAFIEFSHEVPLSLLLLAIFGYAMAT